MEMLRFFSRKNMAGTIGGVKISQEFLFIHSCFRCVGLPSVADVSTCDGREVLVKEAQKLFDGCLDVLINVSPSGAAVMPNLSFPF